MDLRSVIANNHSTMRSHRPIRLTKCCTQFRYLGVKVLCVFYLHDNIAFTFKCYGNTWNKKFYSQRIWIGYNWVSRIGLLHSVWTSYKTLLNNKLTQKKSSMYLFLRLFSKRRKRYLPPWMGCWMAGDETVHDKVSSWFRNKCILNIIFGLTKLESCSVRESLGNFQELVNLQRVRRCAC